MFPMRFIYFYYRCYLNDVKTVLKRYFGNSKNTLLLYKSVFFAMLDGQKGTKSGYFNVRKVICTPILPFAVLFVRLNLH